jgi:hypothetical protein
MCNQGPLTEPSSSVAPTPHRTRYAQKATFKDGKANVLELKGSQRAENLFVVRMLHIRIDRKRPIESLETFTRRADAERRFAEWARQVHASGWQPVAVAGRPRIAIIPKAEP